MATYVIKSWRAQNKPVDGAQNYIVIHGRKEGIVSFLLALVGIDPTITIKVGARRIEFEEASLAGTNKRLIPLESVCSSYYGYEKPWQKALLILVVFFFFGIVFHNAMADPRPTFLGFVLLLLMWGIGIVAAVAYYYLNRTLTLGFVEHSSVLNGIAFKPSIIENQEINESQARFVCDLTQYLIETRSRMALQGKPA